MDKKVLILLALSGATLIASEPPSRLSQGSDSPSSEESVSPSSFLSEGESSPSTSPQEATVRDKLVQKLKIVHVPAAAGMPLDEMAKTLIKRAEAPQHEINQFLASLSAEQIQLLNKIVSCNKIGAQLLLVVNEKSTYKQLPFFVKRLFKEPKPKDEEDGY